MSSFSSKVQVENSTQARVCQLDRLKVNKNHGIVTEFSAMNSFRYHFVKCLPQNLRVYIDPPLEVPEYIQFILHAEHISVHVCMPALEGEQKVPRRSHGTTSATCAHDHCPFTTLDSYHPMCREGTDISG